MQSRFFKSIDVLQNPAQVYIGLGGTNARIKIINGAATHANKVHSHDYKNFDDLIKREVAPFLSVADTPSVLSLAYPGLLADGKIRLPNLTEWGAFDAFEIVGRAGFHACVIANDGEAAAVAALELLQRNDEFSALVLPLRKATKPVNSILAFIMGTGLNAAYAEDAGGQYLTRPSESGHLMSSLGNLPYSEKVRAVTRSLFEDHPASYEEILALSRFPTFCRTWFEMQEITWDLGDIKTDGLIDLYQSTDNMTVKNALYKCISTWVRVLARWVKERAKVDPTADAYVFLSNGLLALFKKENTEWLREEFFDELSQIHPPAMAVLGERPIFLAPMDYSDKGAEFTVDFLGLETLTRRALRTWQAVLDVVL